MDAINLKFNFNSMNKVTMLEFRSNSARILRRVEKGERLVLTHRGRPVARLEPTARTPSPCRPEDPIFHLEDFCFDGPRSKLKNSEIDRVVYGT